MHILIVESDRIIGKLLQDALKQKNYTVDLCVEANEAVEKADALTPAAVICELSLAGHSGLEFLYEFRSYPDWATIPVFIYSSMRPDKKIFASHDWQLLAISDFLYKPDVSVEKLLSLIEQRVATSRSPKWVI